MSLESLLRERLQLAYAPTYLQVINESHGHSVAPGSETHFKVVLVANEFAGQRPVQRHRSVYTAVGDAFAQGVHALAIHAYTPEEWREAGQAPDSPVCLGGSKRKKD